MKMNMEKWKVEHIAHSGFWIHTGREVLLFDYWKGELPALPEELKLYVFASHRHRDHFNPAIFELIKTKQEVFYILSDDIRDEETVRRICEAGIAEEQVLWAGADSVYDVNGLGRIETLRSTDEGVAFLVTLTSGKTIYHAGDLHWWNWEGEPQEWLRNMEADYKHSVGCIKGRHIDMAFLVLDDRLERNFAQGMEYFLKSCQVTYTFPMHYWNDSGVIERYPKEAYYGTLVINTAERDQWELEV